MGIPHPKEEREILPRPDIRVNRGEDPACNSKSTHALRIFRMDRRVPFAAGMNILSYKNKLIE